MCIRDSSYIKLYENCYAKYKTRITEISCPGSGEVKCTNGFYCSNPEYVGEVDKYGA